MKSPGSVASRCDSFKNGWRSTFPERARLLRLPNLASAVIREQKLTGYLLSESHALGRHKASYFRSFGFSRDAWEILRDALLDHAAANDVSDQEFTGHGASFGVDGPLVSPDGRRPLIRAIWLVEAGTSLPYFVTAYPLKRGRP